MPACNTQLVFSNTTQNCIINCHKVLLEGILNYINIFMISDQQQPNKVYFNFMQVIFTCYKIINNIITGHWSLLYKYRYNMSLLTESLYGNVNRKVKISLTFVWQSAVSHWIRTNNVPEFGDPKTNRNTWLLQQKTQIVSTRCANSRNIHLCQNF